jgi:hypothetical protein
MRIMSVALAILMSVVTCNAGAWSMWEISGAKMDIDGKDIRVASVNQIGNEHVFHSKDTEFEKGVYVVAVWYGSNPQSLPRTTAFLRDYLRSRGINVVDQPDGSPVALRFEVRDLNIDGVSTATIQSDTPVASSSTHENLAAQGTDLAIKAGTIDLITKTSGAFAGAMAYGAASSYHYEGDELMLSAEIIPEPTYDKLGENSDKFAKEMDGITARTAVKRSDPKTTTGDLLTLMTRVWVDKYFVKD